MNWARTAVRFFSRFLALLLLALQIHACPPVCVLPDGLRCTECSGRGKSMEAAAGHNCEASDACQPRLCSRGDSTLEFAARATDPTEPTPAVLPNPPAMLLPVPRAITSVGGYLNPAHPPTGPRSGRPTRAPPFALQPA
jgi:hypothetical protein